MVVPLRRQTAKNEHSQPVTKTTSYGQHGSHADSGCPRRFIGIVGAENALNHRGHFSNKNEGPQVDQRDCTRMILKWTPT